MNKQFHESLLHQQALGSNWDEVTKVQVTTKMYLQYTLTTLGYTIGVPDPTAKRF